MKKYYKDNEEIIWDFIQKIKTELKKPKISESGYQTLKDYYFSWRKDFPLIRQYYYLERVLPVVNLIKTKKIKTILDIGCGCGSEAILFALLNCQVLGIDINKERLNCAQERKSYYENLLEKKLKIKFELENFFDLKIDKKFDFIWILETIHHIEPPLEALQLAYYFLNKNGYIGISDPNGLNPLVQIKLFLERGIIFHKEVLNPKSGKMIPYGIENIFTVLKVRQMLKRAGFKIKEISYQRFLPAIKLTEKYFKTFKLIEDLLRKIPFLKNFGVGYTIIAQK